MSNIRQERPNECQILSFVLIMRIINIVIDNFKHGRR